MRFRNVAGLGLALSLVLGYALAAGLTSQTVQINGGTQQACVGTNASNVISPCHVLVDASGNDATGTVGTGIAQPTGGAGILGWLSGIYSKLSGTLTVGLPAGAATSANQTPAVAAGTAAASAMPVQGVTGGVAMPVTVAGGNPATVTTTVTQTTPSCGTSSTTLLAAGGATKRLDIIDVGATDCWISLGGTATLNSGIRLAAGGGSFTWIGAIPTNGITGIATAATNVTVEAGN